MINYHIFIAKKVGLSIEWKQQTIPSYYEERAVKFMKLSISKLSLDIFLNIR